MACGSSPLAARDRSLEANVIYTVFRLSSQSSDNYRIRSSSTQIWFILQDKTFVMNHCHNSRRIPLFRVALFRFQCEIFSRMEGGLRQLLGAKGVPGRRDVDTTPLLNFVSFLLLSLKLKCRRCLCYLIYHCLQSRHKCLLWLTVGMLMRASDVLDLLPVMRLW